MGKANSLRYDEIPLSDFLTAVAEHRQDVRRGLLPKVDKLHALKLSGLYGEGEAPSEDITLYLLNEENPLLGETERFLLLHAPASLSSALERHGMALRDYLRERDLPVLFRIDPRWGLITGSATHAVDPMLKWDKPNAYLCLYVTSDPGHPSLALADYVATEHRKAWNAAFEKANGTPPKKSSLLSRAVAALSGRKGGESAPRLSWAQIQELLAYLPEKMGWQLPTVSVIFYPCDTDEARSFLLPPEKMAVVTGAGRFFASLGELA